MRMILFRGICSGLGKKATDLDMNFPHTLAHIIHDNSIALNQHRIDSEVQDNYEITIVFVNALVQHMVRIFPEQIQDDWF